ncbi:ABC transporter permease [Halocatena salina]|uniref:ABC transporter permease n=1 Tax=Halocatena salina TaxID=2934340 RepID=A0A8U0A7X7_9EURY|nr:ABC transporter permease [Halocatena salina]UPM44608.1 ABC transporter permease [Halocatena salina]
MLTPRVQPEVVISKYVTTSVRASLISMVDWLKSLEFIHISDMMSGMILARANPIYTADHQLSIMAVLFAAGRITCLIESIYDDKILCYTNTFGRASGVFEERYANELGTLLGVLSVAIRPTPMASSGSILRGPKVPCGSSAVRTTRHD